jgi:hypothetical protein
MEEKVEDIEHCLKIYSTEERVINAVITLYVSMLKAIEEVIGFYTKHICKSNFADELCHGDEAQGVRLC